jgi:hypothetical protein
VKEIITGREHLFGPWMMAVLGGGKWLPGRGHIIGLWENGPICGCLFEASNGASIMLHIAAIGKRWMNREYLWFVFYYPFVQLEITKILAPIESTNTVCCRFVEHIGFTLEATLKDAAPKGDLLVYTMTKDQCRWLSLKGKYLGKTKCT